MGACLIFYNFNEFYFHIILILKVFKSHNKSGKLSQHTPVLPQVATAKFKYKKQERAMTKKLSKQEL